MKRAKFPNPQMSNRLFHKAIYQIERNSSSQETFSISARFKRNPHSKPFLFSLLPRHHDE